MMEHAILMLLKQLHVQNYTACTGVYAGFFKRASTSYRVWIYQYTLQGARNGSDYCEMSLLRALSQRNFKILAG